jgi:hypothetical protein
MEKECTNKKEIGKKIQLAKASGETIDYVVDIPICAFICDTTAAALSYGAHASAILASPVIIIECTYLEESFTAEANRKGHIVWTGDDGLCAIVRERLMCQMEEFTNNRREKSSSLKKPKQTHQQSSTTSSSSTITDDADTTQSKSGMIPTTFVLIHFSFLRYTDREIRDFFSDASLAGLDWEPLCARRVWVCRMWCCGRLGDSSAVV